MVKQIIINDDWKGEITNIAIKFNNFAKKGSLRMASFIIDKLFDILADDKDSNQVDAAHLLHRIRLVNPKLISSYISTLIDAKIGRYYTASGDYLTPDLSQYPIRDNTADIIVYDEDYPKDTEETEMVVTEEASGDDPQQENSEEGKSEEVESAGGELLSWDLMQLLQFQIVKNIKPITYDDLNTPSKKCTLADGKFSKGEEGIWGCKKCMAPYHENCIKIVAILEGRCRICEESFLVGEDESKEES